MKQIWARKI